MTSQYVSTDEIAKLVRVGIKTAKKSGDIPSDLTYTVKRDHNSIDINVRGIQDKAKVISETQREIAPGNVYMVREYTEWAKTLEKRLKAIASPHKHTVVEDADYGSVPNFYLNVHFIDPEKGWAFH